MRICRTSRKKTFNLQSFWPALCHEFFPTGSCSDRWSPSYTFGGVVGWDVGDAAQVDAWSTSNHWSVAECLLKIPFTWATFICRFFLPSTVGWTSCRCDEAWGKGHSLVFLVCCEFRTRGRICTYACSRQSFICLATFCEQFQWNIYW